uniref:non-specific serine/threonine protein kinase n=1 Tax=Acrobeloides nanus TaxID=290746 RepID=A0A914DDV5_9BILA
MYGYEPLDLSINCPTGDVVGQTLSNRLQTNAEKHYAIKVYKTTLKEFKNRVEYLKDDIRFKNPRQVLKVG